MFHPSPLDDDDIAALASLHRQSLPGSALSWLGEKYLRAFYRYMERSQKDAVVVHRDASGKIVAAAVIAWEPASLLRRLLTRTSMPLYIVLRSPLVAAGLLRRSVALRRAGTPTLPIVSDAAILDAPEIVDFYTAREFRGQGRGRTLLSICTEFLRSRGERLCWIKTEDSARNPALDFYRSNGFEPVGTIVQSETRFVVLTKALDGQAPEDVETRAGNAT